MGTYIRTGIISAFTVKKQSVDDLNGDPTETAAKIARAIVGSPECFNCQENGKYYTWSLKPQYLQSELAVFLEKYYSDYYSLESSYYKDECRMVIDYLLQNPSEAELRTWLEDNWSNSFIIDEGLTTYYRIEDKEIYVDFSHIRLTYEGKIMFEQFENHIELFERTLRKAYSDHPLGGCLAIVIDS
jgi:hypothetical protein